MPRTKLSLLVQFGNGTVETTRDENLAFVRWEGLRRGGITEVRGGLRRCDVDLDSGSLTFDYHQSNN